MKIFSTYLKYFNLYFSETLNIADLKYVFGFFKYFFDQTLQLCKIGLKWSKMGKNRQNGPTSEDCNFWSKKDKTNLNTYLKSAKFKVSEKYKLKYFKQVEKIFIFFFFIFHFHFRILRKFLKAYILPLRIIFSTRFYFWFYLFSFKRKWPKCADCQNFWNKP